MVDLVGVDLAVEIQGAAGVDGEEEITARV